MKMALPLCIFAFLPAMALFGVNAASSDVVKVSQFGYDPKDSTRFIQTALDSGAKRVVFDRQNGPWVALTVHARSNQEIVFEEGVELQAKRGAFMGLRDSLFNFDNVTNVTLRSLCGDMAIPLNYTILLLVITGIEVY
jgi:hypothetical protein